MYLTTEPIELSALLARVQSPDRGGVACFIGAVRDHDSGRSVERLDYSAYATMAEAECARIVAEAESRWSCGVALRHRIGALAVGDTAVAIAAAAAHREEAFAACRYVIEEVKRRVPIWKREVFADGSEEWVKGGGEAGTLGSGEAVERGSADATAGVELRVQQSEGIGG